MKTKNGNLTVKVGEKIIILSETDVFPGTNQTNTTDIEGTYLLEIIKNEEDIIELLLLSFEIELREMVSQLKCEQNSPDVEIDFFFKRLFALLKQKAWITTLVFNKNINTKSREIEIIIFRMKSFLKNYLSELMNNGKKESISITIKGSNLLIDNVSIVIQEIKDYCHIEMTRNPS